MAIVLSGCRGMCLRCARRYPRARPARSRERPVTTTPAPTAGVNCQRGVLRRPTGATLSARRVVRRPRQGDGRTERRRRRGAGSLPPAAMSAPRCTRTPEGGRTAHSGRWRAARFRSRPPPGGAQLALPIAVEDEHARVDQHPPADARFLDPPVLGHRAGEPVARLRPGRRCGRVGRGCGRQNLENLERRSTRFGSWLA